LPHPIHLLSLKFGKNWVKDAAGIQAEQLGNFSPIGLLLEAN
jgi:hypothetical protein